MAQIDFVETPAIDFQPDDSAPRIDFQPDPEPSVSERADVPMPGRMEISQPPVTALSLEEGRIRKQADEMVQKTAERDRAIFTPEQVRRVTSGSLAENLTTAPPGLEAPMVTPEQIQERFPSMSETSAKVMAGLMQTGAGAWNFMASPAGVATAPVAAAAGMPGLAGLAGKSVLGGFAAEAILNEPEAIVQFDAAVRSGDPEAIARSASGLALNSMVALGAGKAAVESARGIPAQESAIAKAKVAGLEESARALDELSKQTEKGPIDSPSPDRIALARLQPSQEFLSIPDALRPANEIQLTEVPSQLAPEGALVANPALSHNVPREIKLEVTQGVADAFEKYKLARERQLALGKGGKLEESGAVFSGLDKTPGFLRSAEDRITNRAEYAGVKDVPEITTETPLKDVEQIVKEKLEKRDFAGAISDLGQTKAETSAQIIDDLIGVGREKVPLSAGERMIFEEIWESALKRSGAVQPPSFIDRLESLKKPLTPGVGANPFPEIAKAVWNTSLDIAILAVKAGTSIGRAIDSAIAHIKKNASGFDEAKVRNYLSDLVLKETASAQKGERAADSARATIEPPVESAFKPAFRPLGEPYSEPIIERVGRVGKGPVSQAVTRESLGIVDKAKRLIGELSVSSLDAARRAAGSVAGGTSWLNGIRKITPTAAVGRLHDVLETRSKSGTWEHVPEEVRGLAYKVWQANLEIGKLAERASEGFKASGEAQRMLTSYGMDILRRGGGKAWEAWASGLAAANGVSVPSVKSFLRRWKSEIDQPGWDAARLDRISQDFKRKFPNVVTHVKALGGWHEVIHSSPFRYLDQAATRTAHAVAFREVYPLLKDENGKAYSSGKLESTRKAVMAEMETDKHAAEFDNLMRTLQGHPIDSFSLWWNAPDTPVGMTVRALNDAASPLFSAMLSATSFRNIGETISGGAQIFMGYRRALVSAVKERKSYSDLERSGLVNRAILDFSYDPSSPVRSISRITSNTIRKVFVEQLSNEFQEYTGAAAARVIANEIRDGRLPKGDRENVIATMRAMGIGYDDAIAAVAGKNESAVRQFETKAAEFLYGGNRAPSESSPLGASRAFTQLFKWHSYPMTKVRQVRALINNLVESASRKDAGQIYANAKLLGKHLGGTVMAGAITTGIMALINEGLYGVGIRAGEAQEDFPQFLADTYAMAMGGPVQIAARMFQEGGDMNSWIAELLAASAPIGVANDLSKAIMGTGTYEGTGTFERIGTFLESKTSMSRAVRRGMAAFGLGIENPELDAAIRRFKRWRRGKFGYSKFESHLVDDYDSKEFRGHMKKAVAALQKGDMDTYEEEIGLSLELAAPKKVKQSLRSRKILARPNGEKLAEDDYEELQKIIGDKGIELIQNFDSMLNHL